MTTHKTLLDRVFGRYSVLVTPAAATGLLAAEAVLKATERGVKNLLKAIDPELVITPSAANPDAANPSDPDVQIDASAESEVGKDGSSILMQDYSGNTLVSISLVTGEVKVTDPERVDAAADLFWKAIYAAWRNGCKHIAFKNFALVAGRGGKAAGDIRFVAGNGSFLRVAGADPARGGDVSVTQVDEQEFERP